MKPKTANNTPSVSPPKLGGDQRGSTKAVGEIQKLQEEIASLEQNWKRALADYQNLVKRIESEKQEIVKLAGLNIVNKLLPALDTLELAASHTSDQGVTLAVNQFKQVLAEEGLEEINPAVGDKFDPSLHECTERLSGEPVESIAEVVRKGYKINGLVLRPARVKVWQK